MIRVLKRFRAEGDAGLVHRARGRASNNRAPDDVHDRAAALHRADYADHGPTLGRQMLAEHHARRPGEAP